MLTEEIGNLKKKAFEGVLFLGARRIFVQAIFTISNVFLARLLFPSDFGTYAIITFVGSTFGVFTDIGLGLALIQKKKPVKILDLQTVFTFQLGLGLLVFFALNITTPLIVNYYDFGRREELLFRLFSLYFLFNPFKTTSGAILERQLRYNRLVVVEMTEILTASTSTVILALSGFGVFSFVWGAIFGHITGAIAYFVFSPWKMRIKFSIKSFKDLVGFGVPVQLNAILGLFYGPLVLLYFGKKVGAENLGYFQFAASLSVLPLAISDIVNRVAFPLGARVQKNRQHLKKIIESSIMVVSITTLPLVFIGIASISSVVQIIYTDRWIKAVPAIYVGLIQMGFTAYSGIFGQLLLSLGKAKLLRNMAVVWVGITWIVGPVLVNKFNFLGMSLTFLIVASSGMFLLVRLRKEIKFNVLGNFFPFFVVGVFAGLVVYLLRNLFEQTLINLAVIIIIGFLCYLLLIVPFYWRLLVQVKLSLFRKDNNGLD